MITLHLHPLASYCWKVLVGLYETETPFTPNIVDLSDATQRAALVRLSPFGKFPVIEDGDDVVAESTTILERFPVLIPDAIAAEVRARDRFFDLYVHTPMQKIVDDRIRPEGSKDPLGVSRAQGTLRIAYDVIERTMADHRTWAAGETFTMADCSAAPALYYGNEVSPLDAHPHTRAYLDRLKARPSFARVLDEAAPYFSMFPR